MNELNMLLGERRRVTVAITVVGESRFTIREPAWALRRSGRTVASGTPAVNGTSLICTIEPEQAGGYTLEFTFEIAGERLKKRLPVFVEE